MVEDYVLAARVWLLMNKNDVHVDGAVAGDQPFKTARLPGTALYIGQGYDSTPNVARLKFYKDS